MTNSLAIKATPITFLVATGSLAPKCSLVMTGSRNARRGIEKFDHNAADSSLIPADDHDDSILYNHY